MVEPWFFYTIFAVAIWGINQIVDKIILATNKISSFSYLVYFFPAKIILILILFFTFPIISVSSSDILFIIFAMLSGISSVIGYLFYAFAVKREEISRVSALTSIYPIFVAILAAVSLSEIFTLQKYLAISMTVAGATLISYKRISFWKVLPFFVFFVIILANLFWGLENIFEKLSYQMIDVPTAIVYYMVGNMFTVIPVVASKKLRKQSVDDFKRIKIKTKFILFSNTMLWVLAVFIAAFAIYFGPVTLMSTVSITLPLVVLIYATVIGKFYPKVLKEEISKITFSTKLISILLIIFGTYLLIM